ncbi:MAG: hypothetical protein QM831_44865 [Kofleriaceae bacterium]
MDRPIISSRPRTLAVMLDLPEVTATILDPNGAIVAGPSTAQGDIHSLIPLVEQLGDFDRVSAGFVGTWDTLERELEAMLMRPTRAIELSNLEIAVDGVGVELAISLNETFGAKLYMHGIAIPIELHAHPFRKKQSYGEYLTSFDELGRKKWNKRVHKVIAQLHETFTPRVLYVGGRDARLIYGDVADNTRIITRSFTGALELWR